MSGSDKIGSLDQLVEVVRLASGTRRSETTATTTAATSQSDTAAAAQPKSVEQLRRRLQLEVQAVDPRDPEQMRRARRAIVREITLWEFGPRLAEHPEYGAMLEAIDLAISGNDRASKRFATLVDELKSTG